MPEIPEAGIAFAALTAHYHGMTVERDEILAELDAEQLRIVCRVIMAGYVGVLQGMEQGYGLDPGYAIRRLAALREG